LGFGIKNQLGQAFFVPQVDEYQIAVVSIGMDPAGQGYLFAGIFKPKLPAIVCSFEHRKNLSKKFRRPPLCKETANEQRTNTIITGKLG